MSAGKQDVNLDQLLAETATEIQNVLAKSQGQPFAKNADASAAAPKDPMKKDASSPEGSGYESQAPEASASASASPEASASAAPASPEASAAPGADQVQTIEEQLKGLDDGMLQELSQAIKSEMDARMASNPAGGSMAAAAPAAAAPAPDASASAAPMAMSAKEDGEKLVKAEQAVKAKDDEIADLKKSLESALSMTLTLANRPQVRAITDITKVKFVDRGESELSKAEKDLKEMPQADFKKKVDEVTKDRAKLSTLSKKEHDAILDFYQSGKRSQELLKVIQ